MIYILYIYIYIFILQILLLLLYIFMFSNSLTHMVNIVLYAINSINYNQHTHTHLQKINIRHKMVQAFNQHPPSGNRQLNEQRGKYSICGILFLFPNFALLLMLMLTIKCLFICCYDCSHHLFADALLLLLTVSLLQNSYIFFMKASNNLGLFYM